MSDCDGSAAQTWLISEGRTDVRSVDLELSVRFCLDAINVDTSNKVVILECNEKPQQQWDFTNDLCLEVPNSSTSNGEQVQTYPCNNGENQVWNAAELQSRDWLPRTSFKVWMLTCSLNSRLRNGWRDETFVVYLRRYYISSRASLSVGSDTGWILLLVTGYYDIRSTDENMELEQITLPEIFVKLG
ncbi:hypothetical protein BYT27DRAFT_7246501 [Phlegmacium glaucopus]|nr:hypothetical protein BYT27DRAFT_7246501 [Phlegmacium glaucopus]